MEKRFYNIYDDLIRAGIVSHPNEEWKGKHCLAVVRDRRIGKSYSLNELMIDNWERHNFEKKVLYIRNTKEEVDSYARTFNVVNAGKYYMSKTHIYKIELDANGKEIKLNRKIVGLVGSLSTFAKLKSQISDTNFNLVIWDEFNECEGLSPTNAMMYYKSLHKSQYFSFLELLASIEGDSDDLLTLLIGNRVNSQNDILLNWGIEIPTDPPKEYTLDIRDREIDGGNYTIRFINGGYSEYQDLHKGNQLFKALATFNKECENYFIKNDYYIKQTPNVISRSRIDEISGEYTYLALGGSLIRMVEDDSGNMYLTEEYHGDTTKQYYPLNFEAFVEFQNCIHWEKDDQANFAIGVTNMIKDNKVFFSTNWLKYNFIFWLDRTVKYGVI